jgi:uncharacterized protein YjbI with pentapeptide repeats
MKYIYSSLSVTWLLLAFGCPALLAAEVFRDDFSSPDGSLIGTTADVGGTWSQTGSNSTNPIQISAGRAVISTVGQDLYSPLLSSVARSGTNVKTSLDLSVTAAHPNGDYFLHFSNPIASTTLFYQRLFARSSPNGYQLGLVDTGGTGTTPTWGTQELAYGSSHHVDILWHFTPGGAHNDTFTLTLDDAPYLSHTWTSSSSGEPTQIAAANLRQGNSTETVPTVFLDNLVVSAIEVPPAPINVFEWQYVNPANSSQGKQPSTLVAYDGYGIQAGPGLNAANYNLTKAYFDGANLTGASFNSANLTDASLSQANLTNTNFNAANLSGTDLSGALIQGAQFHGIQGGSINQLYSTASYQAHELIGVGLGGNDLSRANFAGQNLSTATFQNATLSRANFHQANLTGANLSGANLTGAKISDAILTDAIIKNAKLSSTQITLDQLYSTASYSAHDLAGIRFIGDDLSGADFSHQALASASFYAANLSDADLSYADVSNGEFVNADVSGANLTGANFTYATFALSDLSNSTLTGANFSGANLIGTNFKGADIRGAILGKIVSAGGGSDGRPCGCGIIWWPLPLPNPTLYEIGSGITLLQLASTASYAAKDLSGATFLNNNFNGGNFAGFNLTNSNFYGTTLTNANFSSADARGSSNLNVLAAANFIRPDGHIAGLNLAAGQSLTIRDYDGTPSATLIPIQVDTQLTMAPGATLRFIFDADDLNSTISFTAGIPVVLSGSLQLLLAEGVDPFSQIGRSFRIFNWDGVSPTGTFAFSSPYDWDFANLYTTGEIDFLGVASFGGGAVQLPVVPEPLTWQLLCVGIAAAWVFRRARFKVMVIIPVALLAFPGGLAFAARPDIHLTQIGNPIWKPVDFLLFSAPATPFAQQAAQIFDTILPNDDFNAYIPHSGPYDSELSTGALAGGYVTKSLFTPQAISLNPNGVYFIYMLVPQPGVTGDSRDFESGPVIPNALFPILNNVDVWLDGVLVDRTPGADAVINVAQLDVDNVGISHLEVMQAIWHPWDDDLAIGPLGRYDLRVSIRDASGSGWNAVVPFRVALPGDYDYSGTVGTEDYAVWKANFGSTTNLDADGNDDHIVDAADYTTWRDNLEATFASGPAGGNAAPEPSTLLLVTMLLAVILPSKRRRPRHAWIPQSKSSRHSPSAVTLPRVDATLRTWR